MVLLIPEEEHVHVHAWQLRLEDTRTAVMKTLGVTWSADEDFFAFHVTAPARPEPFTKRSFLSCVASLFDLLGLAGPVVATGHVLLQWMWWCMVGCEDPLPEDLE